MTWEKLSEESKKSGGMFIQLKDGEQIEGVFRGDPYVFRQIYQDRTEYPIESTKEGTRMRFKINLICKNETGDNVARILSGGKEMADQILEVKEEYGIDSVFKIKRKGTGQDTSYSVLFKGKLSSEQIAEMDEVPLQRLKREDSEISFDPESM